MKFHWLSHQKKLQTVTWKPFHEQHNQLLKMLLAVKIITDALQQKHDQIEKKLLWEWQIQVDNIQFIEYALAQFHAQRIEIVLLVSELLHLADQIEHEQTIIELVLIMETEQIQTIVE